MKKIFLLAATFLLTMVSSQQFNYGVTANIHKTSILGVHDYSKGKFGAGFGVVGEVGLAATDIGDDYYLFFMPQIEYSMQGENAENEIGKYGKQKYHHDYITTGLNIKYVFHPNNYMSRFFVFGGPRISFLVREKKDVDPAFDLVYGKYNLDNEVNKVDLGIGVGFGAKIDDHFEAFLRYDRGFSKVYPNNDRHHTSNHQLALGLNYFINRN